MASDGGAAPDGPKSAYVFFQKNNMARIRSELEQGGESVDFGRVVSATGEAWHSLSADERQPYEDMAAADRARFEEESRKRDQEAAEAQALKRAERETLVVDSKMRERKPAPGNSPESAKRKREESAEVQARREERKKARREHRAAQRAEEAKQFEGVRAEKARAAEARLQFLLKQSDIFAHFGIGKELAEKREEEQRLASASKKEDETPMKRRMSEQEEDERMMAEANTEKDQDHTFLLQQPSNITGQMRPYQLEGLNWMIRLHENGLNGILADEMGLGKTLQSISILGYMLEFQNVRGPHIVLVPKSTLANWMNEFRRWCPDLRVVKFHGTKDERAAKVEEVLLPNDPQAREWDVCITTYEVANLERRALSRFPWRYMVIDEAHRLKNEASQFSQTVREMETQHRLLLTGTPLQNNLHELWALLNFLLPDVFASSEQFDEWFNLDIDDDNAKARMISQLHKLLRPFMLRRLKADVEKTLPPKTETILFVGMSAMQKKLYRSILLRDISSINAAPGTTRSAVLNIVMQLRKCCNHPYLFDGVEDRSLDPLGDHLWLNCGKMVLLDKLLDRMHSKGHRVLLFTQMTRMMDVMEDYCVAKGWHGRYCRIDGNTSYELRESQIDDFNSPDSDKFLFLLSTRAGGLGLNLQTADVCILYDSDWNPQADLQAQDRCHRIGQTKPVSVFRLVTEETVEEKIIERAQKKLKLDAMVVQQGRLQDKDRKIGKNELLDTIRYGADQVFRSQVSSISDEDIDAILEKGRKRTQEMEESLAALKGDAFDFKLDGGISTQTWEGVDYSDRTKREEIAGGLAFINTGKRERKPVHFNYDAQLRGSAEKDRSASSGKRQPSAAMLKKYKRVPKHLRLPRMEEYHFFQQERLRELSAIEEKMYLDHCKENTPTAAELRSIQVLPEDLREEKARLLAEGFGDWTRAQFNAFHKASAKYGRSAYDKIAGDTMRSEADVEAYSQAFWSKGPQVFSKSEWDKIVRNVEKGERKLEEIARLTEATKRFIARFDDPWNELCFQFVGVGTAATASNGAEETGSASLGRGGPFHEEEDRFLLCLADRYGYGNWHQVRLAVRRLDRFRFDYYLQSCTAEALGRRCESLMRLVEKELGELEKRGLKQVGEQTSQRMGESARATEKVISNAKLNLEKVKEAQQSIREQQREAQAEIDGRIAHIKRLEAQRKASGLSAAKVKEYTGPPMPDELLPGLVQLVAASAGRTPQEVVGAFRANHADVTEEQVKDKVDALAFSKGTGPQRIWYIRRSAAQLLPAGTEAKVADPEEVSPPQKVASVGVKPPKKALSALKIFGKKMQKQIKAEMPDAPKSEMVDRLKSLWEELSEEDRRVYEEQARLDKVRYEEELKVFEGAKPPAA